MEAIRQGGHRNKNTESAFILDGSLQALESEFHNHIKRSILG